ncbi:MAG: DUF1624 domain-containing protein [Alphaproteobacteria bacterium]|nr:DUF1624 domain-containing protein [Alphaproteobacteria bacterium]
MQHQSAAAGRTGRLDVFDIARGLALLAMAVYHLAWDLSWFSLVDWRVAKDPAWRGLPSPSRRASCSSSASAWRWRIKTPSAGGRPCCESLGSRWQQAPSASAHSSRLATNSSASAFSISIAVGSLVALPFVLARPGQRLPQPLRSSSCRASWRFPFPAMNGRCGPVPQDPPLSVDYIAALSLACRNPRRHRRRQAAAR